MRKERCQECGMGTVYADDLSALHRIVGFVRETIEKMVSSQGNKVNSELKKLHMNMNTKKTQFTAVMSSQRRQASRVDENERRLRKEELKITIGENTITEAEYVRTLGMEFDKSLNFKQYWFGIINPVKRKIYAISQLGSNLTFSNRKMLAQGLVISKIGYCLEASSCCTKTTLQIPTKLLNRTARVTNRE